MLKAHKQRSKSQKTANRRPRPSRKGKKNMKMTQTSRSCTDRRMAGDRGENGKDVAWGKIRQERRRDSSIGQEDSVSVGAWWSRSFGGRGKEASMRTIIREGAVVRRRGRSCLGGMWPWSMNLHGKSVSGNAQHRLVSQPFYAGRQSRGIAEPGFKKSLAANGPALIGRTIAL